MSNEDMNSNTPIRLKTIDRIDSQSDYLSRNNS